MTTRYVRAPGQEFGVFMPTATVRDSRLSYRARGVLQRLMSNANGFGMDSNQLAAGGLEGRDAIRAALRELENAGYLVRHARLDGAGRFAGQDVYVYSTPQTLEAAKNNGGPENPSADFPSAENTALKSSKSNTKAVRASKEQQHARAGQHTAPVQEKRAAAGGKRQQQAVASVTCWTDADLTMVEELVSVHGRAAVQAAATHLRADGVDPLPSAVSKALQEAARVAARLASEQEATRQEAMKQEQREAAERVREARRADPRTQAAVREAIAAIQKQLGA